MSFSSKHWTQWELVNDRWVLYHVEEMKAEPDATGRLMTDRFRRIAAP
jgi:hypothetical protein